MTSRYDNSTSWVTRASPSGFRVQSNHATPDFEASLGTLEPPSPATLRRPARGAQGARARSVERNPLPQHHHHQHQAPSRPPLSAHSSWSSLDEQRAARRSRRPRAAATRSAAAVPTPPPTTDGAIERLQDIADVGYTDPLTGKKSSIQKPKATDYLNYSFNMSTTELMAPLSPEGKRPFANSSELEHEIATPALAHNKLSTIHPWFADHLAIPPTSPVKNQPQRRRRASIATTTWRESIEPDPILVHDLLEIHDDQDLVIEEESAPPVVPTGRELYEYARQCAWDLVAGACRDHPWTAKYVCETDGTTALHLAVISRANPVLRDGTLGDRFPPASLDLIEQLIVACPEAAIIRCAAKRYTPLSYASLVADTRYDMDDSAAMIKIILRHNPHSALVFTDDGFSAVDVHIISYSRLHQEKAEVYSHTGRSSTVVLRALLNASPNLALARSYGNRVRGPVELLYRCNLKEFKEATGADIVQSNKIGRGLSFRTKKNAHSSVASMLSDWWAWKWAQLLLQVSSKLEDDDDDDIETDAVPFSAVHAAAHLVGCPIPILALAIDAFPELARTRNPRVASLHNCPLHEVCSWVTDDLVMNGDPFVVKRKRKAIAMLLEVFPKAARMTNSLGETPLQLAIETCTPWDSLEKLVKAFPKALTLPRCMENCQEGSPLSKAVAYHNDDVGSVGSDEAEWEDEAIDAVAGMYPFMIAAVLSHVPERRTYAETLLADKDADPAECSKNLRIKELESLRSINGLLRAQPRALAMFIDDEKTRQIEQRRLAEATQKGNNDSSSLDDDDDEETCTEAYVEDAPTAKALEEDNAAKMSDDEDDTSDEDDASDEDNEDDEVDEEEDEDDASYEEESLYTEEEEIEEEVESSSEDTSDYTEIEEVSHL
jgi:hypothetical protein